MGTAELVITILNSALIAGLIDVLFMIYRNNKEKKDEEKKRREESARTHQHICEKLDTLAKSQLENDEVGKLTQSTKDKLRQIVAKELS